MIRIQPTLLQTPLVEEIPNYPVSIKNFNMRSYENDKCVDQIYADELKISLRKFFIFNIKPFNEMSLINATFTLYVYDGLLIANGFNRIKIILSSDANNLFNSPLLKVNTGLVTRGVITNFNLHILRKNKPSIIARSEKAILNFKKNQVTMEYGEVADMRSGNILQSDLIEWSNKTNTFQIPGGYSLLSGFARKAGKSAQLDLEFNLHD